MAGRQPGCSAAGMLGHLPAGDAGKQGCISQRAGDGREEGCLPPLPPIPTSPPRHGQRGQRWEQELRARSIPAAHDALPGNALLRLNTSPEPSGESSCCLLFTCLGVMVPPKINPPSFTRPLRGGTWARSERGAEPEVRGWGCGERGGTGRQNLRWGRGSRLCPGGVTLGAGGDEPKGCIPQPHLPPSALVGIPRDVLSMFYQPGS